MPDRILILDGAFGTMAQALSLPESTYILDGRSAPGCNDVLCITRPDAVVDIHRQYIEAGADIIETNSFNANAISLSDYGLEHRAYDLARQAAALARRAADECGQRKVMVAGSMGPTNRTLSMSPDVNRPEYRETDYEAMRRAYADQARGLIDGGADLLMIETAFDTLNAKAAISAVREISADIPLMVSATLSDASGRTLSGQTIDAFYASVRHGNLYSVGLNCGFGAKHLLPYLRRLAEIAECRISVHPNAGLPNIYGQYDQTPEMMAADMEEYMREGIVDIVGGCCGTTPAHIAAIANAAMRHNARAERSSKAYPLTLSGLEPLKVVPETNFINIGERTNVAGSAKFAKLIHQGEFAQAVDIARAQVEAGAQIIDVCMDDAMIDGPQAMRAFMRMIAVEPEIARVPVMIDSSNWDTIVAGLQNAQGKSIVNSISLKEGEEQFLQKARAIMGYGAAAVVMLFDEKGQADTYDRKIKVAKRAYDLLAAIGFPKEDIIIDPNILSIATGIPEHDRFALDFIEATRWIKANLPGAKVSGGVSNLSFAFRGNNDVRKAMHSAFLYHAIGAGMDMAIVNPQMVVAYDDIDPSLLVSVEDALLCRRPDASDRLIEAAHRLAENGVSKEQKATRQETAATTGQRIRQAMMRGDTSTIQADALQSMQEHGDAISVINAELMPAMEHVGDLFGQGKMFLPQVVKSARVMKMAVDALSPYIAADNASSHTKGTVVLATVKGDVHDIGKNIVSVVLACNGFNVCDLGVMVEPQTIVDKAKGIDALAIGLSGLITPSLSEMIRVAQEADRQGLDIPIIIGGATTTPAHTALKIAPATHAPVLHARDAADTARIANALASEHRRALLADNAAKQSALRATGASTHACPCCMAHNHNTLPHAQAGAFTTGAAPSLAQAAQAINWAYFFSAWGIPGKFPAIFNHPERGTEAAKVYQDAQSMLSTIIELKLLKPRGAIRTFKARAEGDNIAIDIGGGKEFMMPMHRNSRGQCVADYVDGEVTLFVLSAAFGLGKLAEGYRENGDEYSAIMAKLLTDRLTEAMAQTAFPTGCRLGIGYPSIPDHTLKRAVLSLLDADSLGFSLTDTCMIVPGETVCGLWLPNAQYID